MEEKEETYCGIHARWGQLWDRRKEINLDFLPSAPSSIKSQWIAGITALRCLQWNQVLEKRWGKGSMVGPLCPPIALGSH